MDKELKARYLRSIRELAGLSQDQASRLLKVTKRALQYWESGQREIPSQTLELFQIKVCEPWSEELQQEDRDLVLVLADDGVSATPLTVLSNQNYLGHKHDPYTGTIIIQSYMYDPLTRQRYVRALQVQNASPNKHLLKWLDKWAVELRNDLEIPVDLV